MRTARIALAKLAGAVVLVALLAPTPTARALDVDDVTCTCLDESMGQGDVVSCVSRLSLRLVQNGSIGRAERTRLIRDAQRGTLSPPADCGGGGAAELEPLTYGAGVHLDRAFYATGDVAQVRLEAWNRLAVPVTFRFFTQGGAGCNWDFRIFDDADNLVHQATAICLDAPIDIEVLPGDTYVQAVALPLVALNSEAGQPDGTPLPPGLYRVLAAFTHEGDTRRGFTGGLAAIRIE